ncbi:S1C family serine protease [Actinomadura viridis]|uniref:S1C family serine protease n=1 Tax=Actinomadura viridis TaxID=58110 RepID=UPI0036B0F0B7
MTEDSRGPVRSSSEDDELVAVAGHDREDTAGRPGRSPAEAQEPVDDPQRSDDLDSGVTPEDGRPAGKEPQGVADRLVAGFAPPDSYGRDDDLPSPPPPATTLDKPIPGGPAPQGAGPGDPAGHGQAVVPDGIVPDGPVPEGPMPQAPPGPPGSDQGRQRPGFVPHGYDPRAAAHQQPADPRAGGQGGAYGWPPPHQAQPHAAHQPPPGGPVPGPPHGPGMMGRPPGDPRQMMPPGGPGQPPGGPNWAPVPPLPSASRGGPGLGVLAIMALVIALLAGGVGAGVGTLAAGDSDRVSLGGGDGGSAGQINRPPDSVAGVAKRVLPSVVMIRVSGPSGEGSGGTGFIVNGGYIITNNHVVSSGGDIQVVFNDKKTLPASVKGRDPSSDIAVLKPSGQHSLPALTPGNSDQLAVGDPVIAIGSPLGLQGSVTTGIVSSLNRAVPTGGQGGGEAAFLNAIQTDAAINPGNSGGPLVDARGRVIGINTAIATLGGQGMGGGNPTGSIGLGFAIPINQARRVAEEIINTGTVKQAKMGVLPDPRYQEGGARIMDQAANGQEPVTKGGPADRAGLRPGDVITAVDGKPIEDATDLIAMIRSKAPGDTVKVTYQRGGRESTVNLTLAAG